MLPVALIPKEIFCPFVVANVAYVIPVEVQTRVMLSMISLFGTSSYIDVQLTPLAGFVIPTGPKGTTYFSVAVRTSIYNAVARIPAKMPVGVVHKVIIPNLYT